MLSNYALIQPEKPRLNSTLKSLTRQIVKPVKIRTFPDLKAKIRSFSGREDLEMDLGPGMFTWYEAAKIFLSWVG